MSVTDTGLIGGSHRLVVVGNGEISTRGYSFSQDDCIIELFV